MKTVYDLLAARGGLDVLRDPLLPVATQEVVRCVALCYVPPASMLLSCVLLRASLTPLRGAAHKMCMRMHACMHAMLNLASQVTQGKERYEIDAVLKQKQEAFRKLVAKHTTGKLSRETLNLAIYSVGDNHICT